MKTREIARIDVTMGEQTGSATITMIYTDGEVAQLKVPEDHQLDLAKKLISNSQINSSRRGYRS